MKLDLKLLLAASILGTTGIANVSAEPAASENPLDQAKISYKNGLVLETPTFDLKLMVKGQTLYSYRDYDKSEETDREDVSEFDVRYFRLYATGDAFEKAFTYMMEVDTTGGKGADEKETSNLRDGWLQWNIDPMAKARAGQFKIPFSRQGYGSDFNSQMISTSTTNKFFQPSRNIGAMLHGVSDEDFGYFTGLVNGQSDKEGDNRTAVDNNMLGFVSGYVNLGQYGSRGMEGDYPMTANPAATIGLAAMYGQRTVTDVDQDKIDANIDFGFRASGFSLQTEGTYSNVQPDGEAADQDNFGFYVQTGYFVIPKTIEIAGRYSWLNPDEGGASYDKLEEYAALVGYYPYGHNLKIMTGPTWEKKTLESGDSSDDLRYEVMLNFQL